jgi:hypothetical protein
MDWKYFSFGILFLLAAIWAYIFLQTKKAAAAESGSPASYGNNWGIIIISGIAGIGFIIAAFM